MKDDVLLPRPAAAAEPRRYKRWSIARVLIGFVAGFLLLTWNHLSETQSVILSKKGRFEKCSSDTFKATGFPFLETAERPPLEEYILRRNNLAKALIADHVDAFVVEPGYTFSYYANVTQPDWEVWEPEERPFLMVIRPEKLKNGSIIANTTFLVPHFEEVRAKLLKMPFEEEIATVTYEEHWDPYTTLWTSPIWGDRLSPKLMVDEEMRDFIQRGLGSNGFTVVGLFGEVEAVRQTKTEREIGILRAVNTGTVEAIRAMRQCLYHGVTENEVAEVLDNTMRAAGFQPFFDIVEFGKSAALPHGGHDGTAKLEPGDFILIDVGSHLYGYSSDVCRTFYPSFFPEPPPPEFNLTEKLVVWKLVLDAQAASVKAMVPNGTAAAVDIAARDIIEAGGYGKWFTHRLGHSIGIKAHESPYLNKGNFGAILRPGMVFTSEPGVYVLNEFGVRHEDILVVREDGDAENISGGFAISPWEP
ncbi:peptidase M24, structural domain-containing protein [Lophiotrema nucula]|uniref:Peptidase M24, structural domain-containing protein n=1 Tax=Lophiotrema nucula TaxID=690887 RepID=A0A6A5Z657_9PLEO|nr:peptidase M24, structural domain-containing protein [Lophiotrema nucula]